MAEEKPEDKKTGENGEYTIQNARPSMVILPIVVVFVTLFVTLAPLGFPFQKVDGNAFRVALTMGYFFGALVLMVLIRVYKVKTFQETFKLYVDGMKGMTDVAVTLVLAWSLGSMISGLGTADFIVDGMKAVHFSAGLLMVFLFPMPLRWERYCPGDCLEIIAHLFPIPPFFPQQERNAIW